MNKSLFEIKKNFHYMNNFVFRAQSSSIKYNVYNAAWPVGFIAWTKRTDSQQHKYTAV